MEQFNPYDYYKFESVKMPAINNICIKRINDFNEYINSKGGMLVIAGCPFPFEVYEDYTKEDIKRFSNELKQKVNCQVISDYLDYLLPYKYFYNANYHLNFEGTKVRTNLLISDLNKVINK